MARPTGHGGMDTPDYGQGMMLSGYPIIKDLGELAVRLGSPSSYDRYGNIVLMENFQRGFGSWVATEYTSAEDATLTAKYALQGHYAANIHCAAVNMSRTNLRTKYPYPSISNIGLELSMNFSSAFYRFTAALMWGDGTGKYTSSIYLKAWDKEIRYLDADSNRVKVGNWDYSILEQNYWHTMKFVIDMSNQVYLRCSVDSLAYDVHNKPVQYVSVNTYPYLQIILTIESDGRLACDMAIDRVILTSNEPL